MEKYAVVFNEKASGQIMTEVFTKRENALQFATDKTIAGTSGVELFKREGAIQLRAEVVDTPVSNGNGSKKPQRKAAKASAKPKRAAAKAKPKAKAKKRTGFPKRCIAPDCRKKNKGPRFKFLCEDPCSFFGRS